MRARHCPRKTRFGSVSTRWGTIRDEYARRFPKKVPQTEAIFEHIDLVNQQADSAKTELRLSVDTKAVVKLGPLSRDGKNRVPTDAADHDHESLGVVVPVGILLPQYQELWIYMVTSRATADCLVDVLGLFWQENRDRFPDVQRLVLNQDNGPENNSHRTQYIQRIVDLADEAKVNISLAYYPPYHSKYNPVERCWGAL